MNTIIDTKQNALYTILANSGTISVQDGSLIYFDYAKDKIILEREQKKHEFSEIADLACFFLFLGATVSYEKKRARTEWYVISIEKVYASLPSKQLALSYCARMNYDLRISKGVTRISQGVYEYVGPKNALSLTFYIGVRKELEKYGFVEVFKEYDAKEERKNIII